MLREESGIALVTALLFMLPVGMPSNPTVYARPQPPSFAG
jgi:hypothetical protein